MRPSWRPRRRLAPRRCLRTCALSSGCRELTRRGGSRTTSFSASRRRPTRPATATATRLDSDLLAAVLSANETQPPTCEHCREVDHSTEECSLFVLQPGRALVAVASAAAAAPPPTPLTRPSNSNRRTSVGNPPPVCRNFNFSDKEGCTRRGCTYRHCCLLCGGPHKIPSCPDNPDREPAGSLAETTPRGRGGSLRLLPREP